ncbi:MAG: hypothetical protein WCO53_15690 [Deltaproteobacteria bacterium]
MSYHGERAMVDEKKVYKELCDRMGKVDKVYVLTPFKRTPLKAATHPRLSFFKRFAINRRRSVQDWCHNHRRTANVLLFFRNLILIVIGFHLVALIFLLPMIVKQCFERSF